MGQIDIIFDNRMEDEMKKVKEVMEKSQHKNLGQIRITDGPENLSNVNDSESYNIKVKDFGDFIDSLKSKK